MSAPKKTSALARPHVLIVSSDEDLQAFLTEGLVLGGFWVSSVASGLQAVEVFRLRSFDLVLVDTAVQGFGGAEVVRRLRRNQQAGGRVAAAPLTDVPILLISGAPGELGEGDAIAAGADGLLTPPIELADLIPYLFDVVDRWRVAHPDRPWADTAAQAT